MTYPNITAYSSFSEERICIFLEPCKCERNVGEYNTLDLIKDNTKKKTTVFCIFLVPSLKSKRNAIKYYSIAVAI